MGRRARSDSGNLPGLVDRDVARLLALLGEDRGGPLTIPAMRERGIERPAQAIYTLQLAGYQIDRVPARRGNGGHTSGYRLSPPSGGLPEEHRDDAL